MVVELNQARETDVAWAVNSSFTIGMSANGVLIFILIKRSSQIREVLLRLYTNLSKELHDWPVCEFLDHTSDIPCSGEKLCAQRHTSIYSLQVISSTSLDFGQFTPRRMWTVHNLFIATWYNYYFYFCKTNLPRRLQRSLPTHPLISTGCYLQTLQLGCGHHCAAQKQPLDSCYRGTSLISWHDIWMSRNAL